ncbi:hypothetical protein [Legionella sp. 28fT52]|uniref:hypothetical protein n=1 Tax=Legionella sp. 28fT52 TaxID=3410134 RepID=UPI003AF8A3AE
MKSKLIKYMFIAIAIFGLNYALAYVKQSKELSKKMSSTEKNPEIYSGNKEAWANEVCDKVIAEQENLLLHKVTKESCIAAANPAFNTCLQEYKSSREEITEKKRLEKFSICFINKLEITLRAQE